MADASRIAGFLARFAPFDALEPDELLRVAAAVEARAYTAGETVLVEDGSPAQHFYVIRDGSMELVHEDSVCYLLPREQALTVLGRPAGAGFVAATLRERLTRTGHVTHALPELGTVRIAELIPRPPPFCEPFTTIRKAAATMTENDASAILVQDGQRLLILTDA